MKVKIKRFRTDTDYQANINAVEEIPCDSVTEALGMCKKVIRNNKGVGPYIGFRIESLKGENVHKLHNQI